MEPQNSNSSVNKPKQIHPLQIAIEAFSLVSDSAWQQRMLLLIMVGVFLRNDLDAVRLPVYIVNEDGGDDTVLRTVLVELLGVGGIHVQTLNQNVLLQYFAKEKCLIQDLTAASEALFYQVRHLAYLRGIPGNLLPTESPIYGDTVVLIPSEFAELVGLFGILLRLRKKDTCCPTLSTVRAGLRGWGSAVASMVAKAEKEAAIRHNDLPPSSGIPGSVRRAYLSLAATARWLDTNSGVDGFMAAVLECWMCAERRGYARKSSQIMQALIAYYLVPYITNPDAPEHCVHGYRLDLIAEHLRSADAEHFSGFNATEVGKAFMRMGVGTPGRHVFSGGKGKASRIWRSCVRFSSVDKSKLEELSHELQG